MTATATQLPQASAPLDDFALDRILREARTHSDWIDRPVSDTQLRELYALTRLGPTSANCSPARFVFLRSRAAKERLVPALAPGNVEKTQAAPVTAIVAWDTHFYDQLPRLFPYVDARAWYAGNDSFATETAFRNSSMQAAYLIVAARALGLDAGAMSGFDNTAVDREFFPDGRWRSNLLVNLGYGDPAMLHARSPRLEFDEAARIL